MSTRDPATSPCEFVRAVETISSACAYWIMVSGLACVAPALEAAGVVAAGVVADAGLVEAVAVPLAVWAVPLPETLKLTDTGLAAGLPAAPAGSSGVAGGVNVHGVVDVAVTRLTGTRMGL